MKELILSVLLMHNLQIPPAYTANKTKVLDALGYRLTILHPCGQLDKRYSHIVWSPFPYPIMFQGGMQQKREGGGVLRSLNTLKVHKREKFFSSDFEIFTILYLVKLKY